MTSDSKDSHEGLVALEGCRHENLQLVYHIQGFDPECTPRALIATGERDCVFDQPRVRAFCSFGILGELFSLLPR